MRTEPLWRCREGSHDFEGWLVGRGEDGWELQLLRDGHIYASRRFSLHADAVAFGEEEQKALVNAYR